MDLLKKRGTLLRELLKEKGMQAKELADVMCVSCQAVTNWLQGKNEITTDKVLDLCKIFNITSDELLNGEMNNKKDNINVTVGPLKRFVSQLSDLEKFNIIEDFSSGLSKKEIVQKYNLEIGKLSVKDAIGSVQVQNECPNCGELLFLKIGQRRKKLYCENCGHVDTAICKCDYCLSKREKEKQELIEKNKKIVLDNINAPLFVPDYDKEQSFTFLALKKVLSNFPDAYQNSEFLIKDTRYNYQMIDLCIHLFNKGYFTLSKEHLEDIFTVNDGIIDLKTAHKITDMNHYTNIVILKVNFDVKKFYDAFESKKEKIYSALIAEIKQRMIKSFSEYIYKKTNEYKLYSFSICSKEKEKLFEYFEKYSYSNFCRNLDWFLFKNKDAMLKGDSDDKRYFAKHLLENIYKVFDNVEKKGLTLFEKAKPYVSHEFGKILRFSNAKREILFTPFSKIDINLFEL